MSETTERWCRECADYMTALRFGDFDDSGSESSLNDSSRSANREGKWRCTACGGSECLEAVE